MVDIICNILIAVYFGVLILNPIIIARDIRDEKKKEELNKTIEDFKRSKD